MAQRRVVETDNTTSVGASPITGWTVEFLGEQKSRNSEHSHRDLGFTGKLGKHWYAVYGDTLWNNPFYMIRNSISRCTSDPLAVEDLHLRRDMPRQNQFIPWEPAWGEQQNWFIGVSSLLEIDSREPVGAIFYLVTTGIMTADSRSLGTGIAMVKLVNGVPTVVKRFGDQGYWWPAATNPKWGDIAAFRDPKSEYVYAWGGAATSLAQDNSKKDLVFLTRVKARDCFDKDKYEYWWGRERGWSPKPLDQFNHQTAVWKATGQGQVVWNEYLGLYIFVHLTSWGIGHGIVHLRTARQPEGPWTQDVRVFKDDAIDGGFVYAGVAHPYLDESGRTLTVSWTNNNRIRVAKIDFTTGQNVLVTNQTGARPTSTPSSTHHAHHLKDEAKDKCVVS